MTPSQNTPERPANTPKPDVKKIACAKKMRQIMTDYYMSAFTARDNHKQVAWITSGGPVEPLIAMDVIPVYPENYAAMTGASKMGQDLCARAEDMGFSQDLCSYARCDIACAVAGGGPLGGLPKPDMLVCCNNICGTVLKWYEFLARHYNIPLFILDTPICHTGYTPQIADYVSRQIKDYIRFLEQTCGRAFDREKLNHVGRLSLEAQKLWQQVLQTAAARPAPMSAFDAFFFLALIVTLRGTPTAVAFYQELLVEMQDRVKAGISVVPHEKYRLLWDNLPVWYSLKWLSDIFAGHRASLVADTYTSAWCSSIKHIDPDNFLESMAKAYTGIYLNIGTDQMAEQVLDMIKTYQVDAVVMHSNRSCKPYSLGQMDIMKIISNKAGIPVLLLEADMVDPKSFSLSQAETRIDAFMEMIGH